MKTIYKYSFDVADEVSLNMPRGAEFLSIQVQKQRPTMWFLVDDSEELEEKRFRIYGTGFVLDNEVAQFYRGTFQLVAGTFVGHVFEILDPIFVEGGE